MKRYIIIEAFKCKQQIIPFWDVDLTCEFDEECGYEYYYKDTPVSSYPVEVMFDRKTKELATGIVVEYKKPIDKLRFNIDEEVYYEVDFKTYDKSKIVEIVYEEYDDYIKRGKDFDQYELNCHSLDVQLNMIYCTRCWKPFYKLANGKVIKYDHQMKKIFKK